MTRGIVIRGGNIVDGSGAKAFTGDVAINGDRIRAVGFSTNRFEPHKLPDGRFIPGTFADPIELIDIARAIAPRKGLDEACKSRDTTSIATIRASGPIFALRPMLPGRGLLWSALRKQPPTQRLATVDDPLAFAGLVEEAKREGFPTILGTGLEKLYYLGLEASPDDVAGEDKNLLKMAQPAGEHWSQTFLRLSGDSRGKARFTLRMFNADIDGLAHLFASPHSLPSLGDAGAHVSQIMDAGWASFVLSYRVRQRGLFTLEQAIQELTSAPARVIGLTDRGRIAVGQRADLNLLDAARVAELQPAIVNAFPGGAPRFTQRATGYTATMVNGRFSLIDGEFTGERAGRVLRHQTRAAQAA